MSITHTATLPETCFCCRCREKQAFKDAKHVTLKNGKPAMKAICKKCNTSVFSILKGASKK